MGLIEVKADYWRNRDGSIVHTNDCMYSGSKHSHPWTFADGLSRNVVRRLVSRVEWLRLCGKCWPPSTSEEAYKRAEAEGCPCHTRDPEEPYRYLCLEHYEEDE